MPEQQPLVFDQPLPLNVTFEGITYDAALDRTRLGKQLKAVLELMDDGHWRTLREIADTLGYPEASVSARLRDFRKERMGFMTVERRRRGEGKRGLWEYRLVSRETP